MNRQIDNKPLSRSNRRGAALFSCAAIVLAAVCLAACEPSDRTPGFWLRGDIVEPAPRDWTFTDDHGEIHVQVNTPYLIAHSVTIWCAQVDGKLFIAARNPETKKWVTWLNKDRNIRLKIGGKVYDVAAAPVSDDETLAAVQGAYADKYDLAVPFSGENANFLFWSIVPKS